MLVPWLLVWTLGVLAIQYLTVAEPFSPVVIFAFSHGGAEVFVIQQAARGLAAMGTAVAEVPDVRLDHDGLVARWTRGSANAGVLGLAVLFFGGIHLALFGGLGMALLAHAHQVSSWVVGMGFFGAWAWSAQATARHLRTYAEARGDVVVQADLDTVSLTDRGETVRLPLAGASIALHGPSLFIGDRSVPVLPGREATDLAETLALMASRATEPDAVPEPAELARLRGATEPA